MSINDFIHNLEDFQNIAQLDYALVCPSTSLIVFSYY